MRKIIVCMLIAVTMLMSGCSEADKVNANISRQADYFESLRRVTVYNARTDMIILEAEGYMSISIDSDGDLVATCKVGPSQYKKNYVHLNEYVVYVVEDITGTYTDPYHYKLYFHSSVLPNIEVRP